MLDFDPTAETSGKKTRTTQVRHDERLAALIERAAQSLAVDKSTFVRMVVEREASRVLEARSRHVLSIRDAKQFAAAMDAAPEPTPRALKAARNYREQVVYAD